MNQRRTIIVAMASSLALHAAAQTAVENIASAGVKDEDRPLELAAALPQARLVGRTRFTVWGFQVYDARLWALPGATADTLDAQLFALELAYLRAFDNLDIATRSITEMRRTAPITPAQAKAWIDEIQRVIPDVKPGDRVIGVHRPQTGGPGGAQFWVNGKLSGEIRDTEFARLFFGIWLSPKTSEPKMRQALLAGVL